MVRIAVHDTQDYISDIPKEEYIMSMVVNKAEQEEIEMLWRNSEEFRSYQKAASGTDDVEEMLNLLDCYKSMFMVKIKEQV